MPPEQRALHDDMAPLVTEHPKSFMSKRADGALNRHGACADGSVE